MFSVNPAPGFQTSSALFVNKWNQYKKGEDDKNKINTSSWKNLYHKIGELSAVVVNHPKQSIPNDHNDEYGNWWQLQWWWRWWQQQWRPERNILVLKVRSVGDKETCYLLTRVLQGHNDNKDSDDNSFYNNVTTFSKGVLQASCKGQDMSALS